MSNISPNTTELPPFSFSKKPISVDDSDETSRSLLHSNISDVLSSFQITPKKKTPSTTSSQESGLVCRDFDYDEKIRFPRMSNVNNYTYNPCVKPGLMSRHSSLSTEVKPRSKLGGSVDLKESETANDNPTDDTTNTQQQTKYAPATFDLSTPLRRFSLQESIEDIAYNLKKYLQVESPINLSQFNEESLKLLKEYILDNYIYERNFEHQKKKSSGSLSSLDQSLFYLTKKPMCVPAVLRPTVISSSDDTVRVNGSAFAVSTIGGNSWIEEPTHVHWKPSNHCMQCFQTFDYLIVSIVRSVLEPQSTAGRRHHCRFCGYVCCTDCLIQLEQDDGRERLYTTQNGSFMGRGIVMDAQARFVIPKLENGIQDCNVRLVKICKGCADIYKQLVLALNERTDWKDGYIYVENPYVNKGATVSYPPSPEDEVPRKQSDVLDPYRNSRKDSNGVPTDWTWSSF